MDLGRWTLLGDDGTSLLNSICNDGGYRKDNQKHTRNKLVPVYIVSVVSLENCRRKLISSIIEKENYYGSIANHQYLT